MPDPTFDVYEPPAPPTVTPCSIVVHVTNGIGGTNRQGHVVTFAYWNTDISPNAWTDLTSRTSNSDGLAALGVSAAKWKVYALSTANPPTEVKKDDIETTGDFRTVYRTLAV